jgi:hypothetical protein
MAATYEGFASSTLGGSGQPTHRITNFNDSSFGGLCDAVSKGYRSIRFDVAPHKLPSFDRRNLFMGFADTVDKASGACEVCPATFSPLRSRMYPCIFESSYRVT